MSRIPFGRATRIADTVARSLRALPHVRQIDMAGALRRGEDLIESIEFVVSTVDPLTVREALNELADAKGVVDADDLRVHLIVSGMPVTIVCPKKETAGAQLLHLTGSAAHIDRLRELSSERGWTLDARGLAKTPGTPPIAGSEEAIYSALELPWIAPEIREGQDEINAAEAGALPHLVERSDIRGDLHVHTDWSDGRDSIESMIRAAVELGYEYVAITDHSQSSAASRNLSVDSIERQAEEIAALRADYPQITVLHGCEVDILDDGTLDFSDRILERLDIVLASLHEGHGESGDRLLQRYVTAMRNPWVSVITHPTNRSIPYRPGYDIDYDQFFAVAVETGTVVEIDGSPGHLDMDGPLARRAVAAGALVSIDSDCHYSEWLDQQMRFGVMLARRGWLEHRHVLNTRPIAEVRAFIAAKRNRSLK